MFGLVYRVLLTSAAVSVSKGTADLALRCGINSGPTTAGVLRGEKSRFQLFGDVSFSARILVPARIDNSTHRYSTNQTVNTASRMESNGEANKIQVSLKTAELIKAAGKGYVLHHCQVPLFLCYRQLKSCTLHFADIG
jgi:class 3 adenylate cyclase